MNNNSLKIKEINELLAYNFYIPSYQRGYRWTANQIEDLLNDIDNFVPKEVKGTDDKTWYCLQPIVVKEYKNSEKVFYEVIDGQQRLTSIYLILHYLNQYYADEFKQKLFELEYQTRSNSSNFLKEIGQTQTHNNIDFFHMSDAYKTIKNWITIKGSSFNRNNFEEKLKFHTKVIWYESNETNSIKIFTRINIGKIPLTNSELIKALFLNSSNFDDNNEKLKLRQLEIATEWDFIEQSLQRDSFWYFLTGNKKKVNRIEFIFDLMNEDTNENDKYSTFHFFSKKFQNKNSSSINEIWAEIKNRFQRFNEWFEERELYHKIGYLICIDYISIKELYDKSSQLTKTAFRNLLNDLIKNSVKDIDLSELQYQDKDEVKRILLLYNILTILKSNKDNSHFPFDSFKNEKWDIEHITSVKNNMPDKNREEWLRDAGVFIDKTIEGGAELKLKVEEFIDFQDNEKFKTLHEKIISHFNYMFKDEDLNDISNLTLLDSATNRSYKNAVFPIKRKTIIDRDKQGVFVPICTKNVFLKYFSEYPPKISFWTQEDRENYEKDLENILKV